MRKLIPAILALAACPVTSPRLGAAVTSLGVSLDVLASPPGPPPGPGIVYLTWGNQTIDAGGKPGLVLDGGAGNYLTDPVIMGGYVGAKVSGVVYTCQSTAASGAVEDYMTAEVSTDGVLFTPAAPPNAALIDGGVGDGGTPGWVELGPTAFPYSAIALTHVAAQTFDGGYYNDGGETVFIDGGFCDGGNYCDGGPTFYTGAAGVILTCIAATVPN